MDKHVKFTIIALSCAFCGKHIVTGEGMFLNDKRIHLDCMDKAGKYFDSFNPTTWARGTIRNLGEKLETIRNKWENK